jgi:diacylglycerol kinase family enzyme
MIANFQWSVIVNRSTCTEKGWRGWRSVFEENNIPFSVHLTDSLEEVSNILSVLLSERNRHFLFAGGDGTIHHGGNLLLQLAGDHSRDLVIGALPGGTGNDWVRTYGIEPNKIAKSLKALQTVPLNVIKLTWPDGRERYAFNMVGGALDAAVVESLLKSKVVVSGSIKYPIALVKTLLKPHKWKGSINVDGKIYSGDWLTIQAGFGKYCGGGMYVLPHAENNRAALLLMKPKSIGKMVISLSKLYNGKIAEQKEAIALHFTSMEIDHSGIPIPIEADGEWLGMSPVSLEVCYGVLQRVITTE